MPLSREYVTTASRVMLPTYPIFFGVVALSLILTPQARLRATPPFAYADRVLDLDLWGFGFLGVSLALIAALFTHDRRVYRGALSLAFVWSAMWSLLYVAAAFNGQTSYSAWVWPAFVAAACYATLRSLGTWER